jgi:meso-butanediol dehydrogenase/(S,S)-butanediol dehydrogenase/diacetyl reductase
MECVIVVGGAGGIGSACTRLFASRGWKVAILDLADTPKDTLAKELNDTLGAGTSVSITCDVSSEASVEAAFAQAYAFCPNIASLVIMSASFQYGEVHTVTAKEWADVAAINIAGPALCAKQVILKFRERGSGSIVFTSSITANMAFPCFVPYSATKAGLQQMARDVALDNGKYGIRCNCIAPGPIFTQGGTVAHAHKIGVPVETICAELAAEVSLRRMGTVEECAKAVYFLASSESSYITGTTLHVDGGFQRK